MLDIEFLNLDIFYNHRCEVFDNKNKLLYKSNIKFHKNNKLVRRIAFKKYNVDWYKLTTIEIMFYV